MARPHGPEGLSRREWLRLAALAVPAAGLAHASARAQDVQSVPIPPEAARTDPLHDFWDSLPAEFPLLEERRYFNTAGLGISPYEVLERVNEVALAVASEGELHRARYFDAARAAVARRIGAAPAEVALTRNATESMNLLARSLELRPGDEVLLTTHEHPGGAAPWVALREQMGLVIRLYDPVFDPAQDAERLWTAATRRTRVVVVSHVVATVGATLPVEAIAAEARRRGVWCIVDGAQAAGVLPIDVRHIGADAYVASGHKWLLGPVETGFLQVRAERLPELRTCVAGAYAATEADWSLEEARLRFLPEASRFEVGTRSSAQVAGLQAALEWHEALGPGLAIGRATGLARRFREAIVGRPGIEVLTPEAAVERVPIVTFRIPHRPNSQVAEWLASELGMRTRRVDEHRLNAVRASFHVVNRLRDVDWLAEAVRVLGA